MAPACLCMPSWGRMLEATDAGTCRQQDAAAHAASQASPLKLPPTCLCVWHSPSRAVHGCAQHPLHGTMAMRRSPGGTRLCHASPAGMHTALPCRHACRHAWSTHRAVQQPVLREVRAHHVLAHARVHVMPRHAVLQGPWGRAGQGSAGCRVGWEGEPAWTPTQVSPCCVPRPACQHVRKEGRLLAHVQHGSSVRQLQAAADAQTRRAAAAGVWSQRLCPKHAGSTSNDMSPRAPAGGSQA